MSSTGRGSDRIDKDCYPTPYWCIQGLSKKLIENWKLWDSGYPEHIIDAGSGDGRIGRGVKKTIDGETGTSTELTMIDLDPRIMEDDRKDSSLSTLHGNFLNFAPELYKRTLIVSNPPFSLSFAFVQKFIDILDYSLPGSAAFVLLPLNWLGSIKRSHFLKAHPPKSIFVFSTRPSFVKGRTDSNEYCWMIWTKGNIRIDPFQFINKYDLQQN